MAQNEMALVLSEPIEQMVPKLIAWNNKELMAQVKERLAAYVGRIYDESSITVARSDRATLNNFAKALNDERIRIGKIYDAPLVKFKSEVDEVIKAVKEASEAIDEQVKTYEEAKQAERLAENKEYFSSVISEALAPFVSYEKIHKKEWLNASKTPTAVKKEIDLAVAQIVQDVATIEALHDEDESGMKASYFETLNLGATIQAHERRKAEKQRIAAAQEAARVQAQQEPAEPVQTGEAELHSISFKATGTTEQLNALAAYMRANGIKFERA